MTDPSRIATPFETPEKFTISTPIVVLGVFVALLRERFSSDAQSVPALPWTWVNDLKSTGVFIESGFDENMEARNTRPAVWVDYLQHSFGKVALGDQDQMPIYIPKRVQWYYALAEMDMVIDCTSQDMGESRLLAGVVQEFLQFCADIIEAGFGIRSISPIILGRTTPYEKDRSLMNSEIQFRIGYERRWVTFPFANTLNGIRAKIADASDPETYFREIALRE